MGSRARDEIMDMEERDLLRPRKQVKMQRDSQKGVEFRGEGWSWRTFLEKLHFFLEFETAGDALAWLEDGSHFILQDGMEAHLESWLGLRVCSLHQALEALNFECREELHWEYAIYRHDNFIRGNPSKITEVLSLVADTSVVGNEKDMAMPSVAYSAALKPLEVRLSLPEPGLQSWEVTVAPTVLPHPTIDDDLFLFQHGVGVGSSMEDSSLGEVFFDDADQFSDHDMNSPLWWSQHSDFSSICTDDLSDVDPLSQISAYYG